MIENPLYITPIYEPFEPDDKMVEQFRQLMPSVAMMAIALIPCSELVVRKVQGFLNKNFPENNGM